jgi:cysteine-rich repeat protein
MKQFIGVIFMCLLSVLVLSGTAYAICGDGLLDAGEECDDGNTNDYDVCRNDCTIFDPFFPDVPTSFFAFEYIQWIAEKGIASGFSDGTYRPFLNFNRAQAAIIIRRTVDHVQTGLESLNVNGNVRIGNMLRSGSESGTTEGPNYPTSGGMIVRRISSTSTTDGNVVAATDGASFQRDGTSAGFKVVLSDFGTVTCMGVNSSGTNVNSVLNSSGGTHTVYTTAQDVVYMSCSFGDPFGAFDHTTQIRIFREPGDIYWNGFMMSTYDQ